MDQGESNRFEFLRHGATIRTFAAGETVFAEGDTAEYLYVVSKGEVAIEVGGREVERLTGGGMFGEMAIISDRPRTAAATAVADTDLTVVDRRTFRCLVQNVPEFAEHVMRVMAERLERAR